MRIEVINCRTQDFFVYREWVLFSLQKIYLPKITHIINEPNKKLNFKLFLEVLRPIRTFQFERTINH